MKVRYIAKLPRPSDSSVGPAVKAAFAEHGWSDYWILARGRDCEIAEFAAAIKVGRLTDGGAEPIIKRWPRTENGISWKRNLAFGIATNGPVRLIVVDEGGWRALKPLSVDDIVYPNKLKTATTSVSVVLRRA